MKARITIAALFFHCLLFSQEAKIIESFSIPFEPVAASIDRQGFLYFASSDGVIEKYDNKGQLQYHFSPQRKATPSLLEAWQGLRVFVYYQGFQEYLFLNRFLANSERYSLNRFNVAQINGIATLSADNNLWLLNTSNLTLSKIDVNSGELLLENILSLSLENKKLNPSFIREYQNLLFISDSKGYILVFDNLGNFVEEINAANNGFFSFSKNWLISSSPEQIVLTDIYSKKTKEISYANLPYQFVFMENDLLFAISGKRVDILSIN